MLSINNEQVTSKNYYLQIDLLKAFAIISVIILHTISLVIAHSNIYFSFIHDFILTQAVPLFLIIMGRNTGASFKRNNLQNLNQIFSKQYFNNRFERFFIPFLIMFLLSILLGLVLNKELYFGILTLIGYLPLKGPGNYFISMVFQFIFIFPFLYVLYQRSPKKTLILTFFMNLVFDILSANFISTKVGLELYNACIFRYIFLITLGLWAVDNLDSKYKFFREKFLIIGTGISIIYMFLSSFLAFKLPKYIFLEGNWGSQNLISSFYTLFIFYIGFKFLPSNTKNKILRFLGTVGKASYHIFLFQIIFFGIGLTTSTMIGRTSLIFSTNIYILGMITIIFNIIICVAIGMLFYLLENHLKHPKNITH